MVWSGRGGIKIEIIFAIHYVSSSWSWIVTYQLLQHIQLKFQLTFHFLLNTILTSFETRTGSVLKGQKITPTATNSSFSKIMSKVKVKVTWSKILVPTERSCQKEYTFEILKPYLFWLKSCVKFKFFQNSNPRWFYKHVEVFKYFTSLDRSL